MHQHSLTILSSTLYSIVTENASLNKKLPTLPFGKWVHSHVQVINWHYADTFINTCSKSPGSSTHLWNVGLLQGDYSALYARSCHFNNRCRENLKSHTIILLSVVLMGNFWQITSHATVHNFYSAELLSAIVSRRSSSKYVCIWKIIKYRLTKGLMVCPARLASSFRYSKLNYV
jgi:hypothetical protein